MIDPGQLGLMGQKEKDRAELAKVGKVLGILMVFVAVILGVGVLIGQAIACK